MGQLNESEKGRLDFGEGKIAGLFRAIFFPTLIGMIFNSVLTLVDGMFVGRGVGANGIAAVNIVAPLFVVSTGLGLMFGIGASVIAGIKLSGNDIKGARTIMTQGFAAGCVTVGIIGLVSYLWSRATVYMLGCSPELELNATGYMRPLIPGLLFLVVQCIGMMLIRLAGSPRYAMWSQVVPATLNIILDYIMIFPMGMGVGGAAVATSVSCGVGAVMVLIYFFRFADRLKFTRIRISAVTFGSIVNMAKIGFATFLTEGAMGVMMFTGNYAFMKALGESGVAAFSIACYLFPVVFSISNAVAQSAQPIISYNYGAGASGRVRSALRVALFTAIVCGLAVTAFLSVCDRMIVSAFLPSGEEAYALAVQGLPLFSLCAVFFALNVTFIGYYQSIEDAGMSTLYTLSRSIVFLVPAFLLLPGIIGTDGLWLAIPSAEILTLVMIISVFIYKRKIKYNHQI